ncbi:MAG: hypothetical protein KAX20_02420 [Candidatus Omnitrophica bacterium]|nr:hypothetical protein [Candidatus Omnitrophota bacterium]
MGLPKRVLCIIILLWPIKLIAQEPSTFQPYLKLLEKALCLHTEQYQKIWPGYNLNDFPIALYNDKEAYLVNHPSPGQEFQQTKEAIANYPVYHSPQGVPQFRANTSIEYNGSLTSIFQIYEGMPETGFYNFLFHEVFHSFAEGIEGIKGRYGNVLLQPFFPTDNSEYYVLAFIEQQLLKEACLVEDEKKGIEKIQHYYTVHDRRISLADPSFAEFEYEEQIHEGLAEYAGNKGLELMGFKDKAKANLINLLDRKIEAPSEFRGRCYGTGRALAILLDNLYSGWKHNLSSKVNLNDLLRLKIKPAKDTNLDSILAKYEYGQLHKYFSEVLDKQRLIRENLKNKVCQAGCIEIRLPPDTLLSINFDPWNITMISDSVIYYNFLILSAKERFKLSLSGHPVITQNTPKNMYAVKKVMIPIPEKMEVLFNNREINELPEKGRFTGLSISAEGISLLIQNGHILKQRGRYIIFVE